MIVELTTQAIDAGTLLRHVSQSGNGGIAVFYGTVRDNAEGRRVVKLAYEAFEPMAVAKLREIASQAVERWGPIDVAVAHRVGELQIGEPSVVVAVGAPHRAEAFDACRYIIDTLKTSVPIWKREHFEDGVVWVEPTPAGPIV